MKTYTLLLLLATLTACGQTKSREPYLHFQAARLPGDFADVLDVSPDGKHLVVVAMQSFGYQPDTLLAAISEGNTRAIDAPYKFGNFIDDTTMLVIDKQNQCWRINPYTAMAVPVASKLSFEKKIPGDVLVRKWLGKAGIFVSNGNSLLFESDGVVSELANVTKPGKGHTAITSFDVLNDRLLLTLARHGDTTCHVYQVKNGQYKLLHTFTNKDFEHDRPRAVYLTSNSYLLTFRNRQMQLRYSTLDEQPKAYIHPIPATFVENMVVYNKELYITHTDYNHPSPQKKHTYRISLEELAHPGFTPEDTFTTTRFNEEAPLPPRDTNTIRTLLVKAKVPASRAAVVMDSLRTGVFPKYYARSHNLTAATFTDTVGPIVRRTTISVRGQFDGNSPSVVSEPPTVRKGEGFSYVKVNKLVTAVWQYYIVITTRSEQEGKVLTETNRAFSEKPIGLSLMDY